MDELNDLSAPELQQLTGADRSTVYRWRSGRARVPAAVARLVRLRIHGDAAALLGATWSGWRFGRDGLLYAPIWRRGFTSGEIAALPYLYGLRAAHEREQRQHTAQLDAAQAQADDAQARARWYHQQLVSESRLGAMFARLTHHEGD